MGKKTINLRDVVSRDKICAQRFAEAEKLAKTIFDKKSKNVPLPYFTEHGEEHCKSIERYLDDTIWGEKEDSKFDFIPTPEEAMYLLSAAWLHDIGMMYGIFDGEKPEDLQNPTKVATLRDEHEIRTSKYIHEKWKSGWSEQEKNWLTNICFYHRRKHPIESFEPVEARSKARRRAVRLRVLAALARLGDACHVDQSRVPRPMRNLYDSLGMPPVAVCHWEKAKLISDVDFDHAQRKIVLRGECPTKFEFYLGSFDLSIVANIVREDLEEELLGVQKILSRYPNACFSAVVDKVDHIKSLDYRQKQQFLSLWPYLLDKATSSSEATAALVQVLRFTTDEAENTRDLGKTWRDKIRFVMRETLKSRPFDFMIRNLYYEVKRVLSLIPHDATSAKELTAYLEEFLEQMEENCRKMAEFAQGLVKPNDILMVYGYSSNIAKFLENVRPQYGKKSLYVIACSKPIEKAHLGEGENDKIVEFARECGFKQVKFLSMGALALTLGALRGNKAACPCKIPLGTHGILGNEGFLCKVGSYMIVKMAEEFGAKVIAFGEKTKFLNNGESYKEVAGPEKLFSLKVLKPHLVYGDVKCISPKMDFVPRKLVDFVVTEEGVLSTKKLKTTRV
jgi:translation initiation factor 2B subunit (eIF-2B alpha/beta/delta family)